MRSRKRWKLAASVSTPTRDSRRTDAMNAARSCGVSTYFTPASLAPPSRRRFVQAPWLTSCRIPDPEPQGLRPADRPRICGRLAPHVFFFNYTATTEIYTLSLHDAL